MPFVIWFFIIFGYDRPVEVQTYSQESCVQARAAVVDSLTTVRFGGPKFADKLVTRCVPK